MEALIEAHDLHRCFLVGGTVVNALNGVSLSIPKGRLVILRGPSGSGKTTLLNLLGGLDEPTSGRVLYNGRDLRTMNEEERTIWRRKEVGFVFQSFALIPHMTALENVELILRIAGVPWKERRALAQESLQMVGMAKRAHHRALELSGGEQQRIAIARAIANRPALVLADEPTGALDFETGMRVMELFRTIIDRHGITFCVATHDPAAGEFGDHRFYMRDGKLAEEELP
ncbi:MAG: ABC transporter ATP-binding protein [Firmicutes bacterium]|nr:ABC transporter ATP-binding protein [Bacillota bacterium]